uniref:transaldolase n=1 Tax=Toxoplasma gondii COUG TaxID=1074873 RepID=A0A2G8Y866_TOXGO|nr:transaldolase [Toxoplasma gondii COUG]
MYLCMHASVPIYMSSGMCLSRRVNLCRNTLKALENIARWLSCLRSTYSRRRDSVFLSFSATLSRITKAASTERTCGSSAHTNTGTDLPALPRVRRSTFRLREFFPSFLEFTDCRLQSFLVSRRVPRHSVRHSIQKLAFLRAVLHAPAPKQHRSAHAPFFPVAVKDTLPLFSRGIYLSVKMPQSKKRVSAAHEGAASPEAKHQKTNETNGGAAQNALEALRLLSVVVADTGDFVALKKYVPHDATTNPSLLLKAASMPQYAHLMDEAVEVAKKVHGKSARAFFQVEPDDELVEEVIDQLFVRFGVEILKIVPGVVSTEVSAALSFDVQASVEKARKLIRMYKEHGIEKDRVLIKLATTWEGCEAAKILEKEGIHCNMTLLFSFAQAVAAAEAKATLISPFVGRILDYYKKLHPEKVAEYVGAQDPGVQSVKRIYKYYKKHNYKTVVMAASFRNIGEIIALAGCDRVTVSPALLEELKNSDLPVRRVLGEPTESVEASDAEDEKKLEMDEKTFRWMLNEDAMATEKLAEGIRSFNRDLLSLKEMIREKLTTA